MPADKHSCTYEEKLEQANREAKAAVAALACVVAVWIAGGFGLSALDIEVFHTPLWVIGGTIGTWAAAIAAAVVLGRRVFVDCDLDDEAQEGPRCADAASVAAADGGALDSAAFRDGAAAPAGAAAGRAGAPGDAGGGHE